MDARPSPDCLPPQPTSRAGGYFFAQEAPYGMALMRIFLPLVLLIDVLIRHPWAREIYSTDGAASPLGVNFYYPGLVPTPGGTVAVALHALLIAVLVCTSAGWFTRVSLALSTVLYTWFGLLDSLSTVTKYTVIATHMLLVLTVSGCDRLWSIDAWLASRRDPEGTRDPQWQLTPVWPARLLQIFLGIVYIGAAITKMHTPTFFSGDQLMYWTMTYVNNVHPLGDWLSQHPVVLSVFGYITIIWEIAFLFMIFHPRMKWPAIGVGAFFHLMTMFTLGLYVFPMVVYCNYLAYIMADEWRVISNWPGAGILAAWGRSISSLLERFAPEADSVRRPWTAPLGFALTLAVFSLAAVEVEYLRDPYQERGPNGPLALQPMDEDEVAQLLEADRPIRPSDKLLAFDTGNLQIGEHLVLRKSDFGQEERIIAQATITPPHEDMWLDCWLHESRPGEEPNQFLPGRSIKKVGQAVGRETSRANFLFNLDQSLPPGVYFLRLRTGRDDLAIRQFTLHPSRQPQPVPVKAVVEADEELSAN